MTCKADRHKPSTRPKKSETAKRKRQTIHRKRLVALGLPEADVAKMTPQELRAKLRHPKKIQA